MSATDYEDATRQDAAAMSPGSVSVAGIDMSYDEYVQHLADQAPPLSARQRDRVARLMRRKDRGVAHAA